VGGVDVADSVERAAGKFHTQAGQVFDGAVGDPLAARFVDRAGARLDNNYRQAGQRSPDRSSRPGRTRARNE
jgi:hypothetical protein